MGSVERIIEKINEDVQWKLSEFENDANEKIEKIRNEELARWELEKEKIERDGKRDVESIRSLIISRAHLEGKRELMEAREEIMNKVIENIKSSARESKRYLEYIASKVKEAKDIFGEEFIVVCIPEDKQKVDNIVASVAPNAKVEMGAVKHGGVLAKDLQGIKSVDYSIDALIERRINDIRKMIVERLFEGEHA